eukprot:CAMPEP_0176411800 /NCGR_PEP_ID=MMETSP0127-20121128/3797_1 /TAXON_ID=938130 /ORGANISM="Platyophrya macrostoma, Strain WH" /LENGTH=435 /DNA_ID=CAMNT_0017791415 /DNA_START=8 /DNA_END=1315 /DNA_ORIENTATION=+
MWAAIAKKSAAIEQPVDQAPQQVVVAAESSKADSQVVEFGGDVGGSSFEVPSFSSGMLILDANAIIKGMDCLTTGCVDCLVTTTQVVNELRDRSSRDLLDRLPLKLHVLEPSNDSIMEVVAMAGKTGDAGVLSRTDIRLCALALDCCRATGSMTASIEPRAPTINPSDSAVKTVEEEVDEEDMNDNQEESTQQQDSGKTNDDEVRDEDDWGSSGEEDGANDDADGEWITPENIHKVVDGTAKHDAQSFDGGVACVTSDFAMQNVLLHLGVPIVGPRGMRVRELRLWLLRCHACYRLVTDTTKQFCPDCGSGDTLRRVNYVVNANGEKQLFINFARRLSTRGTVFNLPKPRGGKRGTNRTLVLREDQLAHVIRGSTASGSQNAKLQQALKEEEDELAAFGEAPQRRRHDASAPREFSAYQRYNINERKKVRAARRK